MVDESEDESQPKRFPCTEFSVIRHKKEGWVFDIDCRGEVLEPEPVVPSENALWYSGKNIPGDGDIITDRSFEELKGMIRGEVPRSR
jgi:hypothetical protein